MAYIVRASITPARLQAKVHAVLKFRTRRSSPRWHTHGMPAAMSAWYRIRASCIYAGCGTTVFTRPLFPCRTMTTPRRQLKASHVSPKSSTCPGLKARKKAVYTAHCKYSGSSGKSRRKSSILGLEYRADDFQLFEVAPRVQVDEVLIHFPCEDCADVRLIFVEPVST